MKKKFTKAEEKLNRSKEGPWETTCREIGWTRFGDFTLTKREPDFGEMVLLFGGFPLQVCIGVRLHSVGPEGKNDWSVWQLDGERPPLGWQLWAWKSIRIPKMPTLNPPKPDQVS